MPRKSGNRFSERRIAGTSPALTPNRDTKAGWILASPANVWTFTIVMRRLT
jgi:hypothetical protein